MRDAQYYVISEKRVVAAAKKKLAAAKREMKITIDETTRAVLKVLVYVISCIIW